MVFYLVELNKELEVAPRFFGPKLREEIDRRLRQEVRRVAGQLLHHVARSGVCPCRACLLGAACGN